MSTLIGGFASLLVSAIIAGILLQSPYMPPVPVSFAAATIIVLAVAGLALLAATFIWPRPLTAAECQTYERTPRPTAKEVQNRAMRAWVAAGISAGWSVLWAVAGGIRFGWLTRQFWDWSATSMFGLVVAIMLLALGLLFKTEPLVPLPRDDERDRLIKLRSEAMTGRIMVGTCMGLEIILMMLALIFDLMPLMYMGLGFLVAVILYFVVSAIAKHYYEQRL